MALSPDIGNPLYRDALNAVPLDKRRENFVGGFILPDVSIAAEAVDFIIEAENSLNLDAMRGEDAEAKEVKFVAGVLDSISVVEYMQKSRLDKRRVEQGQLLGVDVPTERTGLHRNDIVDLKEYLQVRSATAAASFDADHKIDAQNFRTGDLPALAAVGTAKIVDEGGFEATGGVIGRTAWGHAKNNAAFLAWIGEKERPSLAALADYMEIPEIRLARYRRKIGNGATATEFFPADGMLIFSSEATISNRTFGSTPYVPYGQVFGRAGVQTDVRIKDKNNVEEQLEIAACQRFRPYVLNSNLGYLFTAIVGT